MVAKRISDPFQPIHPLDEGTRQVIDFINQTLANPETIRQEIRMKLGCNIPLKVVERLIKKPELLARYLKIFDQIEEGICAACNGMAHLPPQLPCAACRNTGQAWKITDDETLRSLVEIWHYGFSADQPLKKFMAQFGHNNEDRQSLWLWTIKAANLELTARDLEFIQKQISENWGCDIPLKALEHLLKKSALIVRFLEIYAQRPLVMIYWHKFKNRIKKLWPWSKAAYADCRGTGHAWKITDQETLQFLVYVWHEGFAWTDQSLAKFMARFSHTDPTEQQDWLDVCTGHPRRSRLSSVD